MILGIIVGMVAGILGITWSVFVFLLGVAVGTSAADQHTATEPQDAEQADKARPTGRGNR
jgi:hypothetical protein